MNTFDPKKMGIFPPQTLWLRLRLLFQPKLQTYDEEADRFTVLTYKVLNSVTYVLKGETFSKTHKTQPHPDQLH